jgi:protein-S-isoprenylcysteine O-methyltransferase Ste14
LRESGDSCEVQDKRGAAVQSANIAAQRQVDMNISKSSDPWAVIVILLSVGLFVVAVFVKGFTHELLLEAGVFLVSVKLILMAQKNTDTENRLEERLANIQEMLAAKN